MIARKRRMREDVSDLETKRELAERQRVVAEQLLQIQRSRKDVNVVIDDIPHLRVMPH